MMLRLPIANRELSNQLIDNFLNKCVPTFLSLLQILGHNKARQREKFAHILEEMSSLQEEADNLDRLMNAFLAQQKIPINHLSYFGSWLLFNSLNVMDLYLVTGFELDLYSIYEYHYVYWYLCEVILNWQINVLNRVDNFLMNANDFIPSNTTSLF